MAVRCPNHCFLAASTGRPCNYRTDLRASWPLRFCFTPHNEKIEKKKKNRKKHCSSITQSPYGHRMVIVRTTHDCQFGPKIIIDSCDSRREPAKVASRCPCRANKILRTPDGHPAVTPSNGTIIVWSPCDVSTIFRGGIYWLSSAVCFISIFVFRQCLYYHSIANGVKTLQDGNRHSS